MIDAYASEVPATFRLFELHVLERYFKVFFLKDDPPILYTTLSLSFTVTDTGCMPGRFFLLKTGYPLSALEPQRMAEQ